MQHYYHAFSQNADEANRKRECIEKEILPFKQYIDTAIKSLEKKKVRAKWERIETEFNATLEINGYFYEYKPLSQISLKDEFYKQLDSILFVGNLPQTRDYDEKLFITLENGEKIKISLKDGDIAQDYRVLDRLCNLANTGFEVQDNGNLESKDCHIERSEISNMETKKDCLAMSQNDKIQNLYSSNTGFTHLDSLDLDDDTKQRLRNSNIKKASWSGDDLDIKTLKQWLNNGKLDLDSNQVEIKSLQDNVILLKSDINKANIIQKDGYLLPATLEINYIQDNHKVLQDNKTHKIIYCKNEIKSPLCNPIEKHLAKSYCDFQSLCDKSGNKIDIEKQDSKQVFIKDIKKLDDKTILYDKFGISYTLKKIKNEGFNIRLLRDDDEREDEDEDEIESSLRFFLDSDIQVMAYLDGHKKPQECRVKIINRDEFIIELLYKNRAILPRQYSILETKPNPYPLKCQRNAIQNLIKMPLAQSHTLLKLFASRTKDKISWLTKDSKIIDITEWEVLTDENREGANIQRKFIQQALNTKDFALLEGPPGSGKTTTILELIAQIIKQNKRVLLCGSTHVAIDNVLERLKERELIEKLNIFPIRVGSEGALSEEVREFRLGDFARNYEDSLLEKYSVYNDLEKDSNDENKQGKIGLKFFMQCANLVCGTTIGILRYPAFKIQDEEEDSKKRNKKTIKPIMPDFDYLIIDESSKTTFQEFLVPAMYAKKWIIVGDTRQLSPFVDRDELVDNISNLALRYNKINKGFDFLESSYQQACFLLYLLSKIYKENNYNIKIAMGVSSEILWILEQEIEIRTDEKRDNFGVLNNRLKVGYIKDLQATSYFDNLNKHWIFYDEGLAKKDSLHNPLKHLIPSDFIDFDNLALLYQYKAKHKNTTLMFDNNAKNTESFLKAIKDYKQDRSFASEIAWRLSREFELRTFSDSNKAKNKNQSYTKTIDELLPKSHKDRNLIRNKISSIANISLPSILESLIKGVSDRRSEREDSAIRSGFTQDELKQRHSILSTQGRMHEDISRFPREQFYKEANALKDLSNLNREWSYTRYKKRSVWINVDSKSYRGRNEKEAEFLIKELRAFIDFASNNPHPLNETWSVAVLSFYKGQTRILESKLQEYTGLKHKSTDFTREWNGTRIQMKLCTVDKFQGQEADIVFLSMVNTDKIGFLDNPNRLNVGITRAKFQLVILGKYDYFSQCKDDMLKQFALHHKALHKGNK